MAQTCSEVATIRQSLLNNLKGEASLDFPRNSNKSNTSMKYFLFLTPHYMTSYTSARDVAHSIYEMSDNERERLSNLNLERIEELSKNIDQYDGTYFEI